MNAVACWNKNHGYLESRSVPHVACFGVKEKNRAGKSKFFTRCTVIALISKEFIAQSCYFTLSSTMHVQF
jgi:hypothetical protein